MLPYNAWRKPLIVGSAVCAIHVDHGLHADTARIGISIAASCTASTRLLETVAAKIKRDAGTGLEDAARTARHAAFAATLRPGEILALAHHRDDQAETILLKLLRGAGPEGLGGMRALRPAQRGYLWRPLLAFPRARLTEYASACALHWIEDPSNADTHLRRNFLRAEILPRLGQRWPEAPAALAHSATWARHAADLIESQSVAALENLRGADPATLRWRDWLALPDALRDPVRRWLRSLLLDAGLDTCMLRSSNGNWAKQPSTRCRVRWQHTEVRGVIASCW